jgi:rhodanese-related sulfurtransferase
MANYVDANYTKKHLADARTKVINVLSKDSFGQKHLPGSINVSEEDPDFAVKVQQAVPDKSTPVIVHCSSMECQASTRAARKLEALGYKEVSDFKAGLQGWEEAGNQFESGAETATAPAPAATASATSAAHQGAERPSRPGREESIRHEEPRTVDTPKL